jgi:two-component system nitrogen regulation response regulator GlnG
MPIQLGRVMAVVHVGPEPQPTLVSSDGTSSSTQAFERIVERIAGSPLAVLLIGETGVGKGTLARRIHDGSSRAAGPYVVVGAAAAADLAARDLMASARGGTLVLDEICDVAPAAQPALLVAIDALAGDARLIATSRRDTADARDPQRLIPELHYRVAGLTIVIPPLRARVPEIAELALRIGTEAARELGRPPPVLAPDALAALEHHKWPGNVRELSACITRALALSPGRVLTASHFDLERPDVSAIGMPMVVSSGERARGGALRGAREGAEYERIIEALRASNGNQTHAAKLLGI